MKSNKVILTVDLEEWYHCRWATGSAYSKWKNVDDFFKEYYGTSKPIGELINPTKKLLDIFDECHVSATFFVLGEVCSNYPDLVQEINDRGHNIACHGLRHIDANLLSKEQFERDLIEARSIIEHTVKRKVIGYRAPNLIINPWMIDVLEKREFLFDSSICPARKVLGKYGNTKAPIHPYRLSKESLELPGDREIIEIPIPVFPYLKVPACAGIITRIMGPWWTNIALKKTLSTGHATFFFHPWELAPIPKGIYKRLYFRNCGDQFVKMIKKMLKKFSCITVEDAIEDQI